MTVVLMTVQAFAEPSHQPSNAEAASHDQEVSSGPSSQQVHGIDQSKEQQSIALSQPQIATGSHDAGGDAADADAGKYDAHQPNGQDSVVDKSVDTPAEGAADHLGLSGAHFNDDDPDTPDGKLMSLLMG